MNSADTKEVLPTPELDTHPAQLPAYSETDEHSDSGYERIDTPHSHDEEPPYMTAEEEKAYLASGEQQDIPALNRQFTDPQRLGYQQSPQNQPGDIPTTAFSKGLQVPTCNRNVTSGFPYPDILFSYGITQPQWRDFTSEITSAAQLTAKDWAITVGAGFGTFVASGALIGWLGIIPGVLVGAKLRQSAENRNLRASRNDLEARLLEWNEQTFRPRGFLVQLELPGESSAASSQMDVYSRRQSRGGCCGRNKSRSCAGWWAQRQQRKQRWYKKEQWFKQKSAKRGRIVILPIDQRVVNSGVPLDPAQFLVTEKEQPIETVREV